MRSAQGNTLVISISANNSYGISKLRIEHMLNDLAMSAPEWRIICHSRAMRSLEHICASTCGCQQLQCLGLTP